MPPLWLGVERVAIALPAWLSMAREAITGREWTSRSARSSAVRTANDAVQSITKSIFVIEPEPVMRGIRSSVETNVSRSGSIRLSRSASASRF